MTTSRVRKYYGPPFNGAVPGMFARITDHPELPHLVEATFICDVDGSQLEEEFGPITLAAQTFDPGWDVVDGGEDYDVGPLLLTLAMGLSMMAALCCALVGLFWYFS